MFGAIGQKAKIPEDVCGLAEIKKRALSIAMPLVLLGGCTAGDVASVEAYGQKHLIKQYSGGQLIGQWVSTGKVSNEDRSDGYCFQDEATGRLVEVSGTVQITVK